MSKGQVSLQALSDALGVKIRQVSYLVKQGMPRDSVESAKAWKAANQMVTTAPIPAELETLDDGSLASTIDRHSELVARAQGVWEAAMKGGDPQQGKYQTAYNASLKTLLALQDEAERRAIADRTFIKRAEAEASMKELMSEVLNRLDRLALDVAERCNPSNPPVAVKALEAWVRKTREDLSRETPQA